MFRICNKTLRQNRNTLFQLCPQGESVVTKEVLEKLGYNFQLFTSLFITDKKEIKYICYDYCYFLFLEKQIPKVLIAKWQSDWLFDPWRFVREGEK